MTALLHDLLSQTAKQSAERTALQYQQQTLTYGELEQRVARVARAFIQHGIKPGERIAIYLPKQPEVVISFFAASMAGATFVPINPALKPSQVLHILQDCAVSLLVTSTDRLTPLEAQLESCPSVRLIVTTQQASTLSQLTFTQLEHNDLHATFPARIDRDIAAILYTSGSTGKPKGVVLSHQNLVAGAHSVTSYLGNHADDRLLAVLPLSFDYGLSQITTAFSVGASVCLLDYLLPNDVIKACARYRITGLAGVPPLWMQLSNLNWPDEASRHLRYWTNSGGHMPRPTLAKLRARLPNASPFLMYGLTEAFRSTYLPPTELDRRPDSIGKAIPNADIQVLRDDGSACDADEVGELVHRGALVALGYWNDPIKTAERFKPLPPQDGLVLPEIAVYSGDKVKKDRDGFLYFVGRDDELIKSNAYRISPTEIEEALQTCSAIGEAVVLGAAHAQFGQGIVALYTTRELIDEATLRQQLQQQLPSFMMPHRFIQLDQIPRNANGKMDRAALRQQYATVFKDTP